MALAATGALLTTSARADDSEIFVNTKTTSPPNVLLVIDTSGSMGSSVYARSPYNGATTYAGACVSTNAYIADPSANGAPPSCTAASFPISAMACVTGLAALSGAGSTGYYSDSLVRWTQTGTTTKTYAWDYLLTSANAYDIASRDDNVAGRQVPTNYVGPGNSAAAEWTTWVDPSVGNPNSYWESLSTPKPLYTVYSGNYINWFNLTNPPTQYIGTRLDVVRSAATHLMESVPQTWNFGLMRYSSNGTGGMVAAAVSPLSSNLNTLVTALNSYDASGSTPLSETLYEAYNYYAGRPIYYGLKSVPFTSVAASRVGNSTSSTVYNSPITASCQKNFVIFLTDGQPNVDTSGNTVMAALDTTKSGGCDVPTKYPYSHSISPNLGSSNATDGICAGAVAQYMYNADLSSQPGVQNVQTYFIGFGSDFSDPRNANLKAEVDYLTSVAARGGGKAYTASDTTGLENVFTSIANAILQQSASFVAPTIPVNAFNPTQTLSDVYLSLFESAPTYHWPGNLKKYNLSNGVFLDANGVPAVDPSTQTLRSSAQSFWSASVDGSTVTAGGAASRLPNWDPGSVPPRNVYTYFGAAVAGSSGVDLSASSQYAFVASNTAITAAMLGATGATDAVRADIINYARGEDLKNINNNGLTTDSRQTMGDALHASPAVVIYGGTPTSPDITDGVVYRPDNDGMLHAISTQTGVELWAFIPQEALGQMQALYTDPTLSAKHYVLDGSVQVLRFDVNGDGVIDPSAGDRILLFFGQGRGGNAYYAMDVTDRYHPKFLWSIGSNLLNHGQAWSTPQLARVNVQGATQNSQKIVLVLGGGYDPAEDSVAYGSADAMGNAIYIIDALYGTTLWTASNATGANLVNARMDHAIPADVLVMDTNGDGYADRMYVGDMAGQLWRFDITNGNPAASLVAGGVIASLGAHDGVSAGNNRRFYNTPDVSPIGIAGHQPFFNVAIGSGYGGHPLDTTTTEEFYGYRDYSPFTPLTAKQYSAMTPVTDSLMVDITNTPLNAVIPDLSPGWKLSFSASGEKVLSVATTFTGVVYFTTYAPSGATTSCSPSVGSNRVYAVAAATGAPVSNLQGGNNRTAADRFVQLTQAGIAPNVSVIISSVADNSANSNDTSSNAQTTGVALKNILNCKVGLESVAGLCTSFGARVTTYWNANDAN